MRLGVEAWGLAGDMHNTGMGQYTVWLVRGLAERPGVEVFAYGGPREPRPGWLPEHVRWRAVGRRLPLKFSALHSRLLALGPVVTADRLDLFHSPSVHWRPFYPPVPHLRTPVVVTLHDVIPMTHYDPATLPLRQRLFARWNLRRVLDADAVITVSRHSQADICGFTGCPPERITVIPNGVSFQPNRDPAALERWGARPPYVLYAGSFEPRKNLVRAVEAFSLLTRRGLPHRLVAVVERESGHAPGVLAELSRHGLGERLRLVHSVPEADLRALYTGAELIFFPSLSEGFGYPPLQAAACGVPALVSDIPPLRETLGSWGVYVDPADPAAMACGLERLLGDADGRRRLGAAGPALAASFGSARALDAHLALYRSIRDGRNGR